MFSQKEDTDNETLPVVHSWVFMQRALLSTSFLIVGSGYVACIVFSVSCIGFASSEVCVAVGGVYAGDGDGFLFFFAFFFCVSEED